MKRKNGEGSWGTKTIKGTVYQYYRNQDNKYTYGRTIKEVKEKLKNNKNTSTASKINTLKTYGLYWLRTVKALELEARTYDEYENIIENGLETTTLAADNSIALLLIRGSSLSMNCLANMPLAPSKRLGT